LLIRRWHSFLGMQKKVAVKIPGVITVSECSRKDIMEDFRVSSDKFDVVYNGVDLEQFAPLAQVERLPFRIMATASADIPLKGLSYLLEAVGKLKEKLPEIELTVLGKPKSNGPTEKLIDTLGIKDRVRFVKGITNGELQRLYARASIAVVPSLYEGFGLPAAEAMACGVPVISTTGGALPEVVGDAGVLVAPGDSNALAFAMEELLLNSTRRKELAVKGRQRMERHFNWTQTARASVRAYNRLLGSDTCISTKRRTNE
jgi:glycosyltransferase involved in cell wall biosynthesis